MLGIVDSVQVFHFIYRGFFLIIVLAISLEVYSPADRFDPLFASAFDIHFRIFMRILLYRSRKHDVLRVPNGIDRVNTDSGVL